jgi:hypothetical protein
MKRALLFVVPVFTLGHAYTCLRYTFTLIPA